MNRADLAQLLDQLAERDAAILANVEHFRLLSASQIQRLHFTDTAGSHVASVRTCNRALARLRQLQLIRTLDRRIGGVRSGSAGFVYYLGPTGDRVQRQMQGRRRSRHRYGEPSRHFVEHTLAVAELAVQTIEAERTSDLEIIKLAAEPDSWRSALSSQGVTNWLRPDLTLVAAQGDFETHFFVEVDLDTEHLPVVLRQCLAYQEYWTSGRYQAEHAVFPTVLWVTTSERRARAIRVAIAEQAGLNTDLFRVCTSEEFIATVYQREGDSHRPLDG